MQSWTWIGSIHELDWIGLGGMTVTPFLLNLVIIEAQLMLFLSICVIYEPVVPRLKFSSRTDYEFDLKPNIRRLDWIGSAIWTHVQLCSWWRSRVLQNKTLCAASFPASPSSASDIPPPDTSPLSDNGIAQNNGALSNAPRTCLITLK